MAKLDNGKEEAGYRADLAELSDTDDAASAQLLLLQVLLQQQQDHIKHYCFDSMSLSC